LRRRWISSRLVVQRWQADGWTITRVADPDFDLVLPQDRTTRATLQRSRWLHPRFVTDDWALRIASSAEEVSTVGWSSRT
jgi:hypothetical protein